MNSEQILIRKRFFLPIRLPCFQTACRYFVCAQLKKQSALPVGAQERATVGAHSRLHGRCGVVIRIGIAARSHGIARRNRIQKRAGRLRIAAVMAEQQHLAIKFFAITRHQRPLARLPQIAGEQ